MRIKRCPMTFNNMISKEVSGDVKTIFNKAQGFRNALIKNGLYTVSPLVYQMYDMVGAEGTFKLYMSLNQPIELNDGTDYEFEKLLQITDGLTIRHYDMEIPFEESYNILLEAADAIDVKLDTDYYHIHLNLYGESMVDIYAPIIEDQAND